MAACTVGHSTCQLQPNESGSITKIRRTCTPWHSVYAQISMFTSERSASSVRSCLRTFVVPVNPDCIEYYLPWQPGRVCRGSALLEVLNLALVLFGCLASRERAEILRA